VIRLRLSIDDVSRVRFGFSPTHETVLSIRTLATGEAFALHAPWLRQVRSRLDGQDMLLLRTLVRPAGYIPDFLLPAVEHRFSGFESGLAQVAGSTPQVVADQLDHLAGHALAQRGPGRAARVTLLRSLATDPQPALERIVAALRRYWRAAIAPHWPRIRALLQADLMYRLEQLAAGGVQHLFRTLHPLVSFRGDTLEITKYYTGEADLGRRGLLLVPCVFAWPDVVVRTADPQPAITYSPCGLGRLWEVAGVATTPLADVLGRTRAAVLAQLDLPMSTTQLACLLDLSAPTLSVHLKTLHAAGIVASQRDGRAVLYRRTDLGDRLLAGEPG
jgi:DNA-binding transcriptional ArsR family regulator